MIKHRFKMTTNIRCYYSSTPSMLLINSIIILIQFILIDFTYSWIQYSSSNFVIMTPRLKSSLLQLSNNHDEKSLLKSSKRTSFQVQITHEGRTTFINVLHNETILAALERSASHDNLSLTSLPHQCRRGNCFTCSSRHVHGSNTNSISYSPAILDTTTATSTLTTNTFSNKNLNHNYNIDDDNDDDDDYGNNNGLNPYLSNEINSLGYVLTCSSYVKGDGLKLEIGVCDDVWQEIYVNRLMNDEDTEKIRFEAVAKAMRLADERNLSRWAVKTEKMLNVTNKEQ